MSDVTNEITNETVDYLYRPIRLSVPSISMKSLVAMQVYITAVRLAMVFRSCITPTAMVGC
jgi:hypothetical protein